MRAYFQLFFGLLVPLSGLFIITSVIYFNTGYNFTKALRLGVLSGFFIAIAVSLFTALFLLIMRRGKKPQKSILKRHKKVHSKTTQDIKEKALTVDTDNNVSTTIKTPPRPVISSDVKTIEQKMMLLMDRELAFEIALYAISDQNIGTLTESVTGEGHITVKNDNEVLQLTISSLTRHTSQVVIVSEINSNAAKKIISYMKEKEHSFLQY
jgi:mannitol-specific phosphotransferase system IIBC component